MGLVTGLGCELSGKVLLEVPGECLEGHSPADPRHGYKAMGEEVVYYDELGQGPMGRNASVHKDAVSFAKCEVILGLEFLCILYRRPTSQTMGDRLAVVRQLNLA